MKHRMMYILLGAMLALGLVGGVAAQHEHHHGTSTPASDEQSGAQATPGATASTSTGAFYFTVINHGDEADTLLGITSDAAAHIEIHSTTMAGGVMKMEAQPDGVEIPAGGELELAPGGYHFMTIGLTESLIDGESFTATLHFAQAGDIEITVPIFALAPDADALAEPVNAGDNLEISGVWARQAPKLTDAASPVATPAATPEGS